MGIRSFTKTFAASSTGVTFAKMPENESYAVDAYPEIFRGMAMQAGTKLLNSQGEPVLHILVCLANACARKVRGHADIWCFDSRDPRPAGDEKEKHLLARAEIRKRNLEEMRHLVDEITAMRALARRVDRSALLKADPAFEIALRAKYDKLAIMRARHPDGQRFNGMVRDVLFILVKLGIRHAVAPAGCDAEKLAAQLEREGLVKGVISSDTDCTVYGCGKQIKKVPGKAGRYDVYVRADILKGYALTERQLAEVATALGCDFSPKTAGVGAKTVVKKVKAGLIKFTPEQIAAQNKFLDRTPVQYEFISPLCTAEGLDELLEWLVKVQGFSADSMRRVLAPLYPKNSKH
jgi:hypothetical protein